MKNIFRILYIITSLFFLIYLLLPNPEFPEESAYSLRSKEPADVESYLRRGYYNNENRDTVTEYYQKLFDRIYIFNNSISLFSLRLNYPPEESQTIVRDQTRSTYLEEIVHPFRESLYINGFEPKKDNDAIVVNGKIFEQKIIIKLVDSVVYVRLFIGILTVVFGYIIISLWVELFQKTKNNYET
jgi:hypothetical protein